MTHEEATRILSENDQSHVLAFWDRLDEPGRARLLDQVARIADDLLANRAAVVNYERVDLPEQRRICDFINGVSYVLDCEARRISDIMVLYVPSGVDVSSAKPKPVRN